MLVHSGLLLVTGVACAGVTALTSAPRYSELCDYRSRYSVILIVVIVEGDKVKGLVVSRRSYQTGASDLWASLAYSP